MTTQHSIGQLSELNLLPIRALMLLRKIAGIRSEAYSNHVASKLGGWRAEQHGQRCPEWEEFQSEWTEASLSEQSAATLLRVLDQFRPRRIVEFGGGFSTLLIAKWVEHQTFGIDVVTLESDERWHRALGEALVRHQLTSCTRSYHAPLTSSATIQYELPEELSQSQIADLVLVDGPVGQCHGGPGRAGSFAQALHVVRQGGVILLHDALRAEELDLVCMAIRQGLVHCDGVSADHQGMAILYRQ